MRRGVQRPLGIAAALLWASVSAAPAQETKRPWTDPPASEAPADETVTYPDPPPANQRPQPPAPSAALEQAPPELPASASSGIERAGTAKPREILQAEERTDAKPQPAAKTATKLKPSAASPAKVAAPARTAKRSPPNRGTRDVVATGSTPRRGTVDRRVGDARSGLRRLRSVEEAQDAGLIVTTVRTIQLPDGRRVIIESEPDPRTRLDVVVSPF